MEALEEITELTECLAKLKSSSAVRQEGLFDDINEDFV